LSNTDRLASLDTSVIDYNTRRAHSALGGHPTHPPTHPVDNVMSHDS